MRVDHAQRHVAHVVELVVVGHVAGGDQPDAGLVQPALGELLHEGRALARGQEDEQRVGLGVAHLLQHGREVGRAQRRAQLVEHLAAVERDAVGEVLLGVDARAVVGHQRDDLLDACSCSPTRPSLTAACGSVKLVRTMYGEASVMAEVAAAITTIGVLLCVAIGAVAMRRRRDAEAGQRHDLVVDHQFLRQAARRCRARSASSLTMTSTFLPATLVPFCATQSLTAASICRPVEACWPGHRQDDADLHGVALGLRRCAGNQQGQRGKGGSAIDHRLSPVLEVEMGNCGRDGECFDV